MSRSATRADALPYRETLEALVRYYHHVRAEHERAPLESSMRRRLEDRLLAARERVDRLLAEWVDDELAAQWLAHLHYRAPVPDGPPAISPLLFKGRSTAGSVAEIRPNARGELALAIDGAVVERLLARELRVDGPFVLQRPTGAPFTEIFTASPTAREELVRFLQEGGSPPWEYATELLGDGLVDVHFALTPRGRRMLAGRGEPAL